MIMLSSDAASAAEGGPDGSGSVGIAKPRIMLSGMELSASQLNDLASRVPPAGARLLVVLVRATDAR
jgi:hypothetical protein